MLVGLLDIVENIVVVWVDRFINKLVVIYIVYFILVVDRDNFIVVVGEGEGCFLEEIFFFDVMSS